MVAGANAAFDAFDQDRDGYLNIQELRNLQSITFPGSVGRAQTLSTLRPCVQLLPLPCYPAALPRGSKQAAP